KPTREWSFVNESSTAIQGASPTLGLLPCFYLWLHTTPIKHAVAGRDAMISTPKVGHRAAFDRDYPNGQVGYQTGNAALYRQESENGSVAGDQLSPNSYCQPGLIRPGTAQTRAWLQSHRSLESNRRYGAGCSRSKAVQASIIMESSRRLSTS